MCEVCDNAVDEAIWVADPDATNGRRYLVDGYECAKKVTDRGLALMFLRDFFAPVPGADSDSRTAPASSYVNGAGTSSRAATSTEER